MARKVGGLDRLLRQMKGINGAVFQEASAAIGDEAPFLAQKVAAAAPRRSGRLAASVKAEPKAADSQATSEAGHQIASIRGKFQLVWRITAGDQVAYWARWVEHGTAASPAKPSRRNMNFKRSVVMTRSYGAHMATPAQPYFWPTIRAWQAPSKRRVVTRINKALKGVARL